MPQALQNHAPASPVQVLAQRAMNGLRQHPLSWSLGVLALLMVWAASRGAVRVGLHDVEALWSWIQWGQDAPLSGGAYVLAQLRLPRVGLAVLVGAALGLCGALTQGLFRNPLADPGLLGVSSGAACAAALAIVLLADSAWAQALAWRYWLLPLAAFAGAVGVCVLLDALARWLTSAHSVSGLLLCGIALNALAAAVIGLCTYLATDEQLRSLSFWTLGSLAGARWVLVAVLGVALVLAAVLARRMAAALNALALGEAVAGHVGVSLPRLRWGIVLVVAVLNGLAVAWCGMIGFIGLLAPHLVRLLLGADQHSVLPLSMVLGALLLLGADTLARTLAVPAEIPVGIFTALLGAPFFLLLLRGLRHGG
ncbi:FecCD family ABC transporter permease [Roseateles sp. BYS180W]|uniref:FecCD family ABC transporter permease n=1 Tax=Roseateles rivi TaxID=3299028 RepID=A0ABW7FXU5_9BURK